MCLYFVYQYTFLEGGILSCITPWAIMMAHLHDWFLWGWHRSDHGQWWCLWPELGLISEKWYFVCLVWSIGYILCLVHSLNNVLKTVIELDGMVWSISMWSQIFFDWWRFKYFYCEFWIFFPVRNVVNTEDFSIAKSRRHKMLDQHLIHQFIATP